MRAFSRRGGAVRLLGVMVLLLAVSARPVRAGAGLRWPSGRQASPGLVKRSLVDAVDRAQTLSTRTWLGGNQSALQASLRSDAFWESGRSIEPPTGREARRRGAALLALGLLRTATSVMHVVFGAPSRCGPQKSLDWKASSCKNLQLYGYLGMGLSAAFLLGGSIELGRGLMLKRRHDAWKATHWDHFSARLSPRGPTVQVAQLRPRLR